MNHAHPDVHISMTEITALFDDEAHAAEALRDLRGHPGLAEDMSMWSPAGTTFDAWDARLRRDLTSAGRWAMTMGAIGMVVMAAVVMLVMRELAGVGSSMWLGMLGGAGFGALLGTLVGIQVADPMDDDPLRVIRPEARMRAVTFVTPQPTRARRMMMTDGGTIVYEHGHNLPVVA